MSRLSSGLSPLGRSLRLALLVLAALAGWMCAVQIAVSANDPGEDAWMSSVLGVVALVYLLAGLVIWWVRPNSGMGVITAAAGAVLFPVGWFATTNPVLAAVGTIVSEFPLPVMTWLLLAFPSGRLRTTPARTIVVGAFVMCVALQVPLILVDPLYSLNGALAVTDRPDLTDLLLWGQRIVAGGVLLATAATLAVRLTRAGGEQRRVLAFVYAFGIGAVLVAFASPLVLQPFFGISPTARFLISMAAVIAVPLGLTAAIVTRRFTPTSELQQLSDWLAAPAASRPALRDALVRALGDRSLQLGYWSDDRRDFVDGEGRVLNPPVGHQQVHVHAGQRVVGLISYDSALNTDAEMVRASGRVVAIAIDRDRLTADLRASQRALQRSRRRIVDAGDRERRRIAHDLHDGMQVQLVAIGLQAHQLAALPGASAELVTAATTLRDNVDTAARELRDLVHQVMPAALIERDLRAAIEDLVDRMPVPTRLDAPGMPEPLPEGIQRSAYFIVAEALTNAVRHAYATHLVVRLHGQHPTLHLEVIDDGVGGAHVNAGLGLRGLADRVDVHGGRMQLISPPGEGTHLSVELPCAS